MGGKTFSSVRLNANFNLFDDLNAFGSATLALAAGTSPHWWECNMQTIIILIERGDESLEILARQVCFRKLALIYFGSH